MKKLLLLFITTLLSLASMAQDFPYGELDVPALDMKSYAKDTSAHAVMLNEYGSSRIGITNNNDIMLTYEYHCKIKFFDSKEFESQGSIEIPYYIGDNDAIENVEDIKGITFYKDESGLLHKVELDSKKIYKVKDNKHWSELKFAMPALRNGCIIEVSYKIESPYLHNFHSWYFQGDIPKVNSVYQVHIPALWEYNISLKGYLKLTKNIAKLESKCFTFGSASVDCSDMTYGITDVPAFKEEDYMTSEKNYLSSIHFELQQETNLNTGVKTKYSKEWKDIDYFLKTYDRFGSQLKRKELMKEKITPVIANKTDELEKAKAIYAYIKSNIKWDEREDFVSDDGIKKALENHSGSSGDINIALITALNAAGISTEAVLLSTRTNGLLNKLYPNFTDFNYVIAKVTIGDQSYLLDATDPLLPFGMLPLRCLNDQGRVFSLNKPSYWMDMVTAQRESDTYTFDLTLQDNGKLKGTITHYSIGYSGYLKRREIKKFNSIDEYVENVGGKLPKIKILKSDVVNIDSLDLPIGETYDVEMNVYDHVKHDHLSFSPFLLNKITTNPFKLAERDFPVDWGMPSDERQILTIHLPPNYVVENPMQAVSYAMPNSGGLFFTNYESDNNTFTFSYGMKFTKSIYGPEEYSYLKELYNKIILSEKSEMIFKKK